MLEAIRERAQGWIAKVILALLIVPFALWGIDSYFSRGGKQKPAAIVGGEEITQQAFQKSLRDQREAMGGKVDEKVLRQAVMDQMVNTRILLDAARRAGFAVLEPQVQAMLAAEQTFQENGQFSQARLDAWLRSRGMNQAELMALLQQDHLLRQVQTGLAQGALAPRPGVARLAALIGQQREVNEVTFAQQHYMDQTHVDDQAVREEYEARKDSFATPRQVRVQYAVLSLASLEKDIHPSEADARKYYEANQGRYQEPEQRRASHILIQVAPDAKAGDKDAARAKAQQILQEVRKSPQRFGDLARQYSQDPGSGPNGGDLGAFTRDMMVKPFSDAVWSMQRGEIRGPVESQFGYHIIRLDGVVAGSKMGFDVVKGEILHTLRQEEARRRFAEAAERFSNLAYEQPDSLEPVAREFGIRLETSPWIDERQATPAFLANPHLLEALFSEDSLSKHHNVEAVEVAANTLVSARVVDYHPAGLRPLAEVEAEIRRQLKQAQARQLAIDAGRKALAAARSGQAVPGWSAAMTLSRSQPLNVPQEALRAVFRSPADRLPSYVGAETADGYRLYRLDRVTDVDTTALSERMRVDLRRMAAQEEMRAYMEYLKTGTKIEINPASLESAGD
ncbi:MAG TPA: SurA N-terminal domain-containing protein [Thiobacillaceae bacterium]|nr:SurA N-terminal domain-containing protein [Thiobacillaceae bacterium]HNU63161.1 SurA N-terminal domain-containing protein [Thiobacillaceae bacterium]